MEMTTYHINPDHMFSGELAFLSNMYPCTIRISLQGETYTFYTAEAAFQAGKCKNAADIVAFTRVADGAAAKRLGRSIALREDWELFKVTWMQPVLLCKFTQNPFLLKKLVDTYPLPLIETNTCGDSFWGKWNGMGQNQLGKILMEIRELKRDVPESDPALAQLESFPIGNPMTD